MLKVVCFDLDDTLYMEIDFLKSAYKEISRFAAEYCCKTGENVLLLTVNAYTEMFSAFISGKNAFERLNEFLGLNIPIDYYLSIYREHKPTISLCEDVVYTLDTLKNKGCIIGLITDGRVKNQSAKIEALGLNRWIHPEDIIISESFGNSKPSLENYLFFEKKYKNSIFYYIGDNPEKDFIAPNSLGWKTICLKHKINNIHKQDFSIDTTKLPNYIIDSLSECVNLIR